MIINMIINQNWSIQIDIFETNIINLAVKF